MLALTREESPMRPTPFETEHFDQAGQHWTLEELPWGEIRRDAIVDEEELFYLITTASFTKTTVGFYVHDLARYFSAFPEVANWLERDWQQLELQHASALKRYIQTVWPEFDWDSAYEFFLNEFAAATQDRVLAPNRSLELVACCALEMAAASYYSALRELSREPLLRLLAWHISADAMCHYQDFYRYFNQCRRVEQATRTQVLQAMWQRLKQLNGGDNAIAMKHVYGACHPDELLDSHVRLQKRCRRLVGRHVPRHMGVRMALMPFDLGPRVRHMASPVLGIVIQGLVA